MALNYVFWMHRTKYVHLCKNFHCRKANFRKKSLKGFHIITKNVWHQVKTTTIIVYHLSHLQGYFREYYPELVNSHLNWIRNPFATGVGIHLDMKSQEELIEISNDGDMKIKFSALPLPEFWIYSRTQYHDLAEKALKYILPFATTYLCEKGFSTLTIL